MKLESDRKKHGKRKGFVIFGVEIPPINLDFPTIESLVFPDVEIGFYAISSAFPNRRPKPGQNQAAKLKRNKHKKELY